MSEVDNGVYYCPRGEARPVREAVMGEGLIRWAYQNGDRGLVAKLLFSTGVLSRVLGWWYDSGLSRGKITGTIADLGIDSSEFAQPTSEFRSFNDFFTRHLKSEARPFDVSPQSLASPADGRILVFPRIADGMVVPVKAKGYNVRQFLDLTDDALFKAGAVAVVRLCPADYHRYHYPTSGEVLEKRDIHGKYHSVNPIALSQMIDVFTENKRSCTLVESPVFGRYYYVEVGAFGVGSIVQTSSVPGNVAKMDEKGYFKFGGSTVVLVFERDRVVFSEDLVKNSAKGYETLVRVGETIGTATKGNGED